MQLDTLVRVTTIQAWVSLATLFVVCAGAVAFAILYRVPRKVIGEGILLIEKDRLSQVRALGNGRLKMLKLGLEDAVKRGDVIGEISQEDLQDQAHETSERLLELNREDEALTKFEDDERTTQEKAIGLLRDALNKTIRNSHAGLRVADKIIEGSGRLRQLQQLSDFDLLKDLQSNYSIQNDLNNSHSKLAEVELTRVTSENQRNRARLQRRLEIARLETRLRLDRDKLRRTSQIVAHADGRVTQVLSAVDEYVKEGAPVVLLSSPKTEKGTDDVGRPYESIVFVPAGEGKKIDVKDFVEVTPATVKREEHGFIHGEVVSVSELPATRLAMEAALQHPDLVDTFLKRYAPGVLLRVHVKLKPNDRIPPPMPGQDARSGESVGNRFFWSSSSGMKQRLKTGTMCEAAIVVEQQSLISLVIPWLKQASGIK
jgi:HlyD family secretion protein